MKTLSDKNINYTCYLNFYETSIFQVTCQEKSIFLNIFQIKSITRNYCLYFPFSHKHLHKRDRKKEGKSGRGRERKRRRERETERGEWGDRDRERKEKGDRGRDEWGARERKKMGDRERRRKGERQRGGQKITLFGYYKNVNEICKFSSRIRQKFKG